jgi:hypothetical protein
MSDHDDDIRRALSEHGDDGKTPRHTLFYFYGGDAAGIEQTARRHQFAVRQMLEDEGLILEKTIAVDEAIFASVAEKMQALATQFGAGYDGWECELIAGG